MLTIVSVVAWFSGNELIFFPTRRWRSGPQWGGVIQAESIDLCAWVDAQLQCCAASPSHRLLLKQDLLQRHCLKKGRGSNLWFQSVLPWKEHIALAIEQCNSEHSLKSEVARADTITAPSNIDKVGLLIRMGCRIKMSLELHSPFDVRVWFCGQRVGSSG